MNRRVAGSVLVAALVSVLFAAVSTSGGVSLWGAPQWDPTPRDRPAFDIDASLGPADVLPPDVEERGDPIELPGWLTAILRVIAVAAVFAAIIAVTLAGWRHRPRVRWRRQSTGDGDFVVLPDVAAAVVEQAAAQRTALLSGAPRNAIVQCWLRLEGDVAAAGLARDPADTALEFTERVLASYAVDPEAIAELAALYREARFSDHPMDEAHRQRALDALDRLHRTLDGTTLDTATIGSAT